MCDIDESIRIKLLTTGKLKQALPTHARISYLSIYQAERYVQRYLRPGRLWKPIVVQTVQFVRGLWIGPTKDKIWHSTYYTIPHKWDGPSVVTVVDMIYERFPELFNRPRDERLREQKRRCVLAAEAVICVSETTRKDVHRFYGVDPGKVRVVPLAYSDVFRRLKDSDYPLTPATTRPFLLYVGERAHHKNFDGLLSAYGVWPSQKEVALVVVGKQWSADEKKRLVELGIRDRVHLLQDIDDDSLCHLYNQAAALVYSSLYEGFGIPLLEAMACGCPTVASRIPSTVEVAGSVPIYFEPRRAEDLLVALDRVLLEGRRSQRTLMGLRHVKQYSWDKAAEQTLEVYRNLSR